MDRNVFEHNYSVWMIKLAKSISKSFYETDLAEDVMKLVKIFSFAFYLSHEVIRQGWKENYVRLFCRCSISTDIFTQSGSLVYNNVQRVLDFLL